MCTGPLYTQNHSRGQNARQAIGCDAIKHQFCLRLPKNCLKGFCYHSNCLFPQQPLLCLGPRKKKGTVAYGLRDLYVKPSFVIVSAMGRTIRCIQLHRPT